jgi:hypothetical protein
MGARRNDLGAFGCGALIKFKWAKRFMFLRGNLGLNRSKISAEREGNEPCSLPLGYQSLVGLRGLRSRIWQMTKNVDEFITAKVRKWLE